MKKIKINNKWDILLPEHRASRPEWFTEKGWERKRLDLMSEKIGKDSVVFYVGAEEGEFPALCSMWGAKKVVLFEPNNLVWSNLRAVWEENRLPIPLSFVGFASDKDTHGEMLEGFPECAYGEIISNHAFKELRGNTDIPEIKIDTVVQKLHMIPDFIILDVEGSEGKVLRGAEKTLSEHHPKIFLSGHPEFMLDYGEHLTELRKWIIDLGYEETLIDYPLHEVHFYYE